MSEVKLLETRRSLMIIEKCIGRKVLVVVKAAISKHIGHSGPCIHSLSNFTEVFRNACSLVDSNFS
jgi:hypothetical protein